MAEETKVKPTPIQRNAQDVAIELLKLHIDRKGGDCSVEGLQNMYAKFYTCAKMLESISFTYCKDYLPDELKEIAEQF